MIKIVPLVGVRKVRCGRGYEERRHVTAMDSIMEGKYCIGHIKREPGAAICLLQQVSESTKAEIRRTADERDRAMCDDDVDYTDRKLVSVPEIPQELLE